MIKRILLIVLMILLLAGCSKEKDIEDEYANLIVPGDGTIFYRYNYFQLQLGIDVTFTSDFKLGTEISKAMRHNIVSLGKTYGNNFRIVEKKAYVDDEEYYLFSVNNKSGQFLGIIVCNLYYGAYPVSGNKSDDINQAIYSLRGYGTDTIFSSVSRNEEGKRENGVSSVRSLNEKGYALIEDNHDIFFELCGEKFFLHSLVSGHDEGHLICIFDIETSEGEDIGIMYDTDTEEICALTGNYTGNDKIRIRAEDEWSHQKENRIFSEKEPQ